MSFWHSYHLDNFSYGRCNTCISVTFTSWHIDVDEATLIHQKRMKHKHKRTFQNRSYSNVSPAFCRTFWSTSLEVYIPQWTSSCILHEYVCRLSNNLTHIQEVFSSGHSLQICKESPELNLTWIINFILYPLLVGTKIAGTSWKDLVLALLIVASLLCCSALSPEYSLSSTTTFSSLC